MKIIFSTCLALCLIFISCKKDRVCSCTVNTTGSTTTRTQSAGVTFTLNLGIPLPIPPITLSPAKDTTIVTPYTRVNSQKSEYHKVSKGAMKKNCPATSEETFSDGSTTVIPGTSTVTTNKSEIRHYECSVD